ncbi:MAG: hypothetical protein E5V36_07395 [Mesorhizobium sp.]|nr:MAG: hypothetical protein E5V36_07395 [Mesorhizobium sp.]
MVGDKLRARHCVSPVLGARIGSCVCEFGEGMADLTDAVVVDRIEQGGGVAGAARKRGSLDTDAPSAII